MFSTMRLDELKNKLQDSVHMELTIKNDDVVVNGLKSSDSIYAHFTVLVTGERIVTVGYQSRNAGGSMPCKDVYEAVNTIYYYYKKLGYKLPHERITQLSLF